MNFPTNSELAFLFIRLSNNKRISLSALDFKENAQFGLDKIRQFCSINSDEELSIIIDQENNYSMHISKELDGIRFELNGEEVNFWCAKDIQANPEKTLGEAYLAMLPNKAYEDLLLSKTTSAYEAHLKSRQNARGFKLKEAFSNIISKRHFMAVSKRVLNKQLESIDS